MGDVTYVSSRGRSLRIRVRPGGEVVVSVPNGTAHTVAEAFVNEHASWIRAAQTRMQRVIQLPKLPRTRREYSALRHNLLVDMTARVRRIEAMVGVSHTRIVVRRAKTRWGSCSRRGTISFTASLAFLPDELREYIAVHEVCHLLEHNHSRAFWAHVASLSPEYKKCKDMLRHYRM